MGQRTRMGRARTGGAPISRAGYRGQRQAADARRSRAILDAEYHTGQTHPGKLDNAAGRVRFAAKHAAEPRVKYTRTEQSSYSGPKVKPPKPAVVPRTFQAYRKVGVELRPDGSARPVYRLIAAIQGR